MKLNNPLQHPFRVPRVEKPHADGRFHLPNGRRIGVAKAIIERPRIVQPWWVWPIEIRSMLLPGPLEVGMGVLYRFSTDFRSAQGIQR